MEVYAIGGLIGCGKSAALDHLNKMGEKTISADKIVNHLYQPGNNGYKALKVHFPTFIRGKKIDRKALMNLISTDDQAREFLDSIMHPLVFEELQSRLLSLKDKGVNRVFAEVPVLFTSNYYSYFTSTVFITIDEESIIKRMMKRNAISSDEARERVEMSRRSNKHITKADFTINNDKTINELKTNIQTFINKIT